MKVTFEWHDAPMTADMVDSTLVITTNSEPFSAQIDRDVALSEYAAHRRTYRLASASLQRWMRKFSRFTPVRLIR